MTRKEEIIARAEEAEKETTFSDIVLEARGVCSAFGIGYLEGADWADHTMIDKACEWLKNHSRNDFTTYNSFGQPTFHKSRMIKAFITAMEE